MASLRHPVETAFPCPRDAAMEERYRHLHYDPSGAPPFWAHTTPKAVALGRFKRHLPAIPKRKIKDSGKKEQFEIIGYPKMHKDKYGSVSAHSTSAIYGALRAPQYHTIYSPNDVWYASVRSLNRGIHRDVVYTAEAYEWRETLYEETTKEVFAVAPPIDMIPRPPCMCMMRRRPPHDGSIAKGSRLPRCKICAPAAANGSSNGVPPSLKRLTGGIMPMKKPMMKEEKTDSKHESTSRMSGYKKCVPMQKFKNPAIKELPTKESRKILRKSILECDVTAYDLIKKVSHPSPATSGIDDSDSDIDDNLSDNAIAKMNRDINKNYQEKSQPISPSITPILSGTARQIANKKLSAKFKKSQSENCIYSESHSVLVGGQRIFTDNHRSKSPNLNGTLHLGDERGLNKDSLSKWRTMSASDESVCIPDPDYDFSDDSDDNTVINSNFMDPKFTYSPPPLRKSTTDGLGYGTRELSKSMSSLQSDDTFVPCMDADPTNRNDCDISEYTNNYSVSENPYDAFPTPLANGQNSKQDSKSESSSDCSSSGGTLSDYMTCNYASSNELKSILKKKKRRENAIQELEDASRVFRYDESKDSQRKKQVQFRPGHNELANKSITGDDHGESDNEFAKTNKMNGIYERAALTTVINDTYQTLFEANNDASNADEECYEETFNSNKGAYISINNPFAIDDGLKLPPTCNNPRNLSSTTTNYSDSDLGGKQASLSSALPPKLPPGRSNSLEDIRGNKDCDREQREDKKNGRSTLPKRRFSDLHLHLLLCPTKSSFCGNASGSDDLPLASSSQRGHRSLPESPSGLDDVPPFCFDFLDKKDKGLSPSRSVFYVPVEANESNACSSGQSVDKGKGIASSLVLPSSFLEANTSHHKDEPCSISDIEGNLSPEQYDTDDDILENDYEIMDPIYEELADISSSSERMLLSESEPKSFFEGASKTDILSYLEGAKERGLSTEGTLSEDEKLIILEEDDEEKVLSDEDSGEKNLIIQNNSINPKQVLLKIEEGVEDALEENAEAGNSKNSRISEVERNDSGVGTETSKPARMKVLPEDWEEQFCADCDHPVEPQEDEESGLLISSLLCTKCEFRRAERKEIIVEFVDTEMKYGRDLRIIKEEFYNPMEIAGLLTKEQLSNIFVNLDELTAVSKNFFEKLKDAVDIALEHGDEDYTTVNIGKIFLETSSMLHAFETYCVKQASASMLLSNLEKEKELLRIFLRVSTMENTLLRRMNLAAFLMLPVQRVTRYPLLLCRLHKVTPIHHKDRNALKEAQQKVQLHLEHINQQTKGVGNTKIWRRISNISASHRRLGKDIGSIKLRKMAVEVLNWKQDETRFVLAGKILFTQITDYPWNKKGKTVKFTPLHALLVALGKPNANYRPESMAFEGAEEAVLFPRNTGIKDASLILIREKNSRFILVRDPLFLGNCVISCEGEPYDVFEIQEYTTKDSYLLKGETAKETKEWLMQLRYHAKDLGAWRKRRNALANIMINGTVRQ